jgi:hypothetical protein
MKLFLALFATALLSYMAPVAAATAESDAEAAARTWLGLVDAGNYSQSWSSASTAFRKRLTDAQWQAGVTKVRGPLGVQKSRNLESATPKQTIAGEPPGNYVELRFASAFEHKPNATETVTVIKELDGVWRVHGYSIR